MIINLISILRSAICVQFTVYIETILHIIDNVYTQFPLVINCKIISSVSHKSSNSVVSSARQLIRSPVLNVIIQLFIRVSPALATFITTDWKNSKPRIPE